MKVAAVDALLGQRRMKPDNLRFILRANRADVKGCAVLQHHLSDILRRVGSNRRLWDLRKIGIAAIKHNPRVQG